jgi:sortase A
VGEEIVVERAGQPPARFTVRETMVADARTASIRSAEDTSSLVLLTCYPFDAIVPGGPLRYVVVADRSPGRTANAASDGASWTRPSGAPVQGPTKSSRRAPSEGR